MRYSKVVDEIPEGILFWILLFNARRDLSINNKFISQQNNNKNLNIYG